MIDPQDKEYTVATETWQIDPVHSGIHFSIRHFVVGRVHGRFTKLGGTIQIDDANPANSKVEAHIDASTVDTNDEKRDGHLKTADFFNVAEHPQITFKSTRVEAAGKDKFRVTGDLTLRGAKKSVTMDVEHGGNVKDPWGNNRGGFSMKTQINRKDFGIMFDQLLEGGGPALGDTIDISIDVEATKTMQAAAS
jgi:polyisoprenoid-binding protein YceI